MKRVFVLFFAMIFAASVGCGGSQDGTGGVVGVIVPDRVSGEGRLQLEWGELKVLLLGGAEYTAEMGIDAGAAACLITPKGPACVATEHAPLP